LWGDIRGGWYYAAAFSVIALVIIGFAAAGKAGGAEVRDLDQVPLGLPLVIGGYFLGGTLGGAAFWLLRPLRNGALGWMLTGAVIAPLAYGAIGVTGIVGLKFGVNLLDLESAQEGWRFLPWIAVLTAIPGSLVGLFYWSKER
jgi:hypothetical protein